MSNYYRARDTCFNPENNNIIIPRKPSNNIYTQPTIMRKTEVPLNIEWKEVPYADPNSPEIWGPAFWYTIHKSSLNYPSNPTDIVKEHFKNFIYSIPYLLPCEKCQEHARDFIESRCDEIDDILSSKVNLFNFFVDMHNNVNERNGKNKISREYAWELYTRKVDVKKMVFN